VLRPFTFWTERDVLHIAVTRLVIKLYNFKITDKCYAHLSRMR